MSRNINSEKDLKKFDEIRQELQQIENHEIEGLIVRSKIQWHEEGEKSSKYFYDLIKSNATKTQMRKLISESGETLTNQQQILKEQQKFYFNLLSSKIESPVDLKYGDFLNENVPKLNSQMRESCEGLITKIECEKVLKTFKKNKTPGNDGLPIEFYIHFWTEINDLLVESYRYAYEFGELSNSQK